MLTGWCRARSFGDLGERNPFSSEVAAKWSTHFLDSSDESIVLGGHSQWQWVKSSMRKGVVQAR